MTNHANEGEKVFAFITESNRIEGIHRPPTGAEIGAHARLLAIPQLTIADMIAFVQAVQPDALLRDRAGLNVYVGNHVPPAGGQAIAYKLDEILERANAQENAYLVHQDYEHLHPFTDGNGRSGRALWLWMRNGKAPLGFLHQWYYESLQNHRTGATHADR